LSEFESAPQIGHYGVSPQTCMISEVGGHAEVGGAGG